MPNGMALHESLAIPMLNGVRFPGIGDYGLDAYGTPAKLMSEQNLTDDQRRAIRMTRLANPVPSQSTSNSVSPPNKQKRSSADGAAIDGEQANGDMSYSAKKQRPATGTIDLTASQSARTSVSTPNKRKRSAAAEDALAADGVQSEGNASVSAKKQRASLYEETEKILRDMREAAEQMDEGADWYREQRELWHRGQSPWGV